MFWFKNDLRRPILTEKLPPNLRARKNTGSHVSISHIFINFVDSMAHALQPHNFSKIVSIFNWKWRALTFLKIKNFTSGQKHRERIGTAVPKHRKTSKTDQNSKSYPKKKPRGGHLTLGHILLQYQLEGRYCVQGCAINFTSHCFTRACGLHERPELQLS